MAASRTFGFPRMSIQSTSAIAKPQHHFLLGIVGQNRHEKIEEPVLQSMIDEIKKNSIYMLKRIQHENIHSIMLLFFFRRKNIFFDEGCNG